MVPEFVKVCLFALFLKNVLSDNYFLGSSYVLNYGGYNLNNAINYTAKLVYPDNSNGLIISDAVQILSTETNVTLDSIPLYGTTYSFSIPQGTNGTVGLYYPSNSTTPAVAQDVTIMQSVIVSSSFASPAQKVGVVEIQGIAVAESLWKMPNAILYAFTVDIYSGMWVPLGNFSMIEESILCDDPPYCTGSAMFNIPSDTQMGGPYLVNVMVSTVGNTIGDAFGIIGPIGNNGSPYQKLFIYSDDSVDLKLKGSSLKTPKNMAVPYFMYERGELSFDVEGIAGDTCVLVTLNDLEYEYITGCLLPIHADEIKVLDWRYRMKENVTNNTLYAYPSGLYETSVYLDPNCSGMALDVNKLMLSDNNTMYVMIEEESNPVNGSERVTVNSVNITNPGRYIPGANVTFTIETAFALNTEIFYYFESCTQGMCEIKSANMSFIYNTLEFALETEIPASVSMTDITAGVSTKIVFMVYNCDGSVLLTNSQDVHIIGTFDYFIGSSFMLDVTDTDITEGVMYTAKLMINGVEGPDIPLSEPITPNSTLIKLDPIDLYGSLTSIVIPQETPGSIVVSGNNSTLLNQNVTIYQSIMTNQVFASPVQKVDDLLVISDVSVSTQALEDLGFPTFYAFIVEVDGNSWTPKGTFEQTIANLTACNFTKMYCTLDITFSASNDSDVDMGGPYIVNVMLSEMNNTYGDAFTVIGRDALINNMPISDYQKLFIYSDESVNLMLKNTSIKTKMENAVPYYYYEQGPIKFDVDGLSDESCVFISLYDGNVTEYISGCRSSMVKDFDVLDWRFKQTSDSLDVISGVPPSVYELFIYFDPDCSNTFSNDNKLELSLDYGLYVNVETLVVNETDISIPAINITNMKPYMPGELAEFDIKTSFPTKANISTDIMYYFETCKDNSCEPVGNTMSFTYDKEIYPLTVTVPPNLAVTSKQSKISTNIVFEVENCDATDKFVFKEEVNIYHIEKYYIGSPYVLKYSFTPNVSTIYTVKLVVMDTTYEIPGGENIQPDTVNVTLGPIELYGEVSPLLIPDFEFGLIEVYSLNDTETKVYSENVTIVQSIIVDKENVFDTPVILTNRTFTIEGISVSEFLYKSLDQPTFYASIIDINQEETTWKPLSVFIEESQNKSLGRLLDPFISESNIACADGYCMFNKSFMIPEGSMIGGPYFVNLMITEFGQTNGSAFTVLGRETLISNNSVSDYNQLFIYKTKNVDLKLNNESMSLNAPYYYYEPGQLLFEIENIKSPCVFITLSLEGNEYISGCASTPVDDFTLLDWRFTPRANNANYMDDYMPEGNYTVSIYLDPDCQQNIDDMNKIESSTPLIVSIKDRIYNITGYEEPQSVAIQAINITNQGQYSAGSETTFTIETSLPTKATIPTIIEYWFESCDSSGCSRLNNKTMNFTYSKLPYDLSVTIPAELKLTDVATNESSQIIFEVENCIGYDVLSFTTSIEIIAPPQPPDNGSNGLSAGAIVGIVCAGVLVCGLAAWWICMRKSQGDGYRQLDE